MVKIIRVVFTGRTYWHSQEHQTLRRFRLGSQTKLVQIKDPSTGKPAMQASREVVIQVVCADGVTYRFVHDAGLTDEPSRQVCVHGKRFDIDRFAELPPEVEAAHRRARRRARAALRVMRAEFAALPTYRPMPK